MGCCACAGSCNHIGNHSFCSAHGGTGAAVNMLSVWQMQDRAVDALSRELALAVIAWLASDGDDDCFAEVERLAQRCKDAFINT